MAATADDTIARHDVAPRASEPIESTAGRDRSVIDSGGVARVALETRSSRGLVLAVICFPIVLCGCIIGWVPLGWRSPVAMPSAPIVVEPSPTTEARLPDLPIAGLPGAPPLAVWAPEGDATIRVSMWRADTPPSELEARRVERARLIPLGRIGQPADVAAAILFLLSPAGSFTTGHVVNLTGGELMF